MRMTRNMEQGTRNRKTPEYFSLRSLILVSLAAVLAVVTFAMPSNTGRASAHPLGNFSINRLSIIEVTAGGARLTNRSSSDGPNQSVRRGTA